MLSTKSGTTRYYAWYYEYYEVLWGSRGCYKWYYEILQGTTSGRTSHYEELRVVLGGTTRYYELFYESLCGITRGFRYNGRFFRGILPKIIFQKNRYEQFHRIHRKPTVIESLHWWNYNYMSINLLKKDSTVGVFQLYWTTVNFDALLIVMNETEHSVQRRIQNPVKHLKWSFIWK